MNVVHQQQVIELCRFLFYQRRNRLQVEFSCATPASLTVQQAIMLAFGIDSYGHLNTNTRYRYHQALHLGLTKKKAWILRIFTNIVRSNEPQLLRSLFLEHRTTLLSK